MPQVQLRRFEQILQTAIGRLVSRTQFSDVSDASIAKNLLAADAREQDEAYFQMTRLRDLFDLRTAAGEDLTERAQEIAPNTLVRLPASFAIGNVTFGRTGTSGTVIIPSGTVVKTSDGTEFRTTLQGQITAASSTSAPVPITAVAPGAEGNVPPGTIIRFSSKPPGVDTVTNGVGTTQGRDLESDDAFRERARNYIASLSRCTPQALEFAAIGLTDATNGRSVEFARVFEDPIDRGNVTLYIDDGAGTAAENGTPISGEVLIASALGGEEFLTLSTAPINFGLGLTITSSTRGVLTLGVDYFVNPASGRIFFNPALATLEQITADYTPYINLIPTVQNVIDGDPNDRRNFPGFRAAGVLVQVLSPAVVPVSVEGILSIENVDRTTVIANAQQAVLEYVNGLGISGDIVRNEIIERIMGVNGVVDVDLILPTSNITILDDQIPRITSTALINLT